MKRKSKPSLAIVRKKIKEFLKINIHNQTVDYEVLEKKGFKKFDRQLIRYKGNEQDDISAFLFIPKTKKIKGAVLVHHQHNGERHFGKSEVSGIIGDPTQFFCPALCKLGFITLAPDAICFEDRRKGQTGLIAGPDDDFLQHYNEMCYRILKGETLMKKVIEESSIGISLLQHNLNIDTKRIGILGHSYGGNTVIFHSAIDERIHYSCSSGAVCSYKTKMKYGTGIEMAEVIPGFFKKYDIDDVLKCISPRKLLILSASKDKYSQDAKDLYKATKLVFEQSRTKNLLQHKAFKGKHALTKKRFRYIIDWFAKV